MTPIHHILHEVLHQYGAFGLAILLAGGIVGLPIPDETLLVMSGFWMHHGDLPLIGTILAAYAGSCIGMTISYVLGLKLGMPLLHRVAPKLRISEKHIFQAEVGFLRYGKTVLIIGYYIPGLRQLSAFFAGVSKMPFRIFVTYAYTGALIWISIFLGAGYFLGRHFSFSLLFQHFADNPDMLPYLVGASGAIGLSFVLKTYLTYRAQFSLYKNSLLQ